MSLSTHVLDTGRGRPAAGVPVRLESADGTALGAGVTDGDGRLAGLPLAAPGRYRLVFDTAAWFAATGTEGFFPEVAITFTVTDAGARHHVPLLLSPFAYSTYRGS
ncbi:5-hydroxyisourate hydrolase [Actinocatenispora thailandica]|uniref:5-hydroxyisourate hydrolase n=1 Tax=Actinocatenispora thailandica TaxID=227318 RepID=A0A7R7DMJ7_9ACTN|nr:hydroxyisourate hydrolase [Actinocatenispora thailandica]BCJ34316.1 5-hydroxyisourate hydrolase [Actinocatenispora thailandica]